MDNIIEKIQKSFSVQAENFENKNMNFSKQEYLDYTIKSIGASKIDHVLEVAAGTCACGRSIASGVASVTCIDATPAMLEIGKKAAKENQITNISFVEGLAEKLPFEDNSFDIVMTRLTFHHFAEMKKPFEEMDRVLKPDGKLVIIDMEATEETLREIEDDIETLRDFSHVKNRSKEEFLSLYNEYGYEILLSESTPIPVELSAWMQLTNTSLEGCQTIIEKMENEMEGNGQTGFFPYKRDGKIYFNQRWLMMIGKKVTGKLKFHCLVQ